MLFGGKMVLGWKIGFGIAFLDVLQTYVFKDWGFLIGLLIVVIVDTFLGVWKAFVKHELSSAAYSKFFTKIIVYACFLLVVHALTSFPIDGEKNNYFDWFKHVAYSALMVREALSIIEHISYLSPNLIPTWIIKRLKDIDDDGKLNDSVK